MMNYFRCASSQSLIQRVLPILLCSLWTIAAADPGSTHHPVVILPHAYCSAPTLQELFLEESPAATQDFATPECPAKRHHVQAPGRPQVTQVAELNETTLEKALDLVHSSNGTYIAVLYYATWCPFSREVRPVYDVLSTLFPTVHHVAVEESSVRPSVLSQYGVHSFPILFMHNRSARVRYYGPRNLEYLIRFYQNYTGLNATKDEPSRKVDCAFARLVYNAGSDAKEGCPYPWAISPEKWLQDDMYLNLAVVFLVLRLVYFFVPALLFWLKQRWLNGNSFTPSRANPQAVVSPNQEISANASQVGDDADHVQTLAAAAAANPSAGPPAQVSSSSRRAGPSQQSGGTHLY